MDFLLRNFKHLTTTPENIEQLKKLILQMAVQGKLTAKWREENPDVEPAGALLEKIKSEKEQLIKEGKTKRQKPLPPISDEEKPFNIPEFWEWTRLGFITNYGQSPKIDSKEIKDENTWILELEDIEKTSSKLIKKIRYKERKSKSTKSIFYKNNVLYGKLRPYLDKVIVADEDGICTTEIIPLKIYGNLNPYFIKLTLKRKDFLYYVNNQVSGMRMPRLKTESGMNAIVPVPPVKEQKTIVSKVNNLFSQIDKLYELAQKRMELREKSATALFNKINTAKNDSDFQEAWELLKNNFKTVVQSKESVKQLRQSILQLAVQGKLTAKWREENPDVEPASALLEKIKSEKEQLIKEGKIKRQKPLPPISKEEKPFVLPETWEWARIGFISIHNSGKTLDKSRNKGTPRKYITTSNLYWGYFKLNDLKEMLIRKEELERYEAKRGDLLVCEGGEAGRAAVWESSENICFQNHIHRVKPLGNINAHYLYRFFEKINFSGEINNYRKGMAISNLSGKSLSLIPVPIPPVTEQKAIVTKVNRLMEWCGELEKQIQKRNNYQLLEMQTVLSNKYQFQ